MNRAFSRREFLSIEKKTPDKNDRPRYAIIRSDDAVSDGIDNCLFKASTLNFKANISTGFPIDPFFYSLV